MRPAYVPQIRLFQDWLGSERGLSFDSYDALWRWSVTDLQAFWQSLWDFDRVDSPTPPCGRAARRAHAGCSLV